MPHTGSGRQPDPPSGHTGSKHPELELYYRSIWSKPTVDILRRQGAINSLNPKIASYSRPATVLRFSCANPTGLQVWKQCWKPPQELKPRVTPGLGSGSHHHCAAGSSLCSPCRGTKLSTGFLGTASFTAKTGEKCMGLSTEHSYVH